MSGQSSSPVGVASRARHTVLHLAESRPVCPLRGSVPRLASRRGRVPLASRDGCLPRGLMSRGDGGPPGGTEEGVNYGRSAWRRAGRGDGRGGTGRRAVFPEIADGIARNRRDSVREIWQQSAAVGAQAIAETVRFRRNCARFRGRGGSTENRTGAHRRAPERRGKHRSGADRAGTPRSGPESAGPRRTASESSGDARPGVAGVPRSAPATPGPLRNAPDSPGTPRRAPERTGAEVREAVN